ncbi:hypothetical protein XM57_00395 [Burkholderia cepacia]|nr:hypothetical protein XM57_00395 [Burkholderia cepacia]
MQQQRPRRYSALVRSPIGLDIAETETGYATHDAHRRRQENNDTFGPVRARASRIRRGAERKRYAEENAWNASSICRGRLVKARPIARACSWHLPRRERRADWSTLA